jgi:hypothetical protein
MERYSNLCGTDIHLYAVTINAIELIKRIGAISCRDRNYSSLQLVKIRLYRKKFQTEPEERYSDSLNFMSRNNSSHNVPLFIKSSSWIRRYY